MPYKNLEKKKKWEMTGGQRYKAPEYLKFRNGNRLKKLEKLAGREKSPVCEICGEGSGLIVFDHNHSTGKFRGWICSRDNKIIGYAQDNPVILEKIKKYLEVNIDSSPILDKPIKVNNLIVGLKLTTESTPR